MFSTEMRKNVTMPRKKLPYLPYLSQKYTNVTWSAETPDPYQNNNFPSKTLHSYFFINFTLYSYGYAWIYVLCFVKIPNVYTKDIIVMNESNQNVVSTAKLLAISSVEFRVKSRVCWTEVCIQYSITL